MIEEIGFLREHQRLKIAAMFEEAEDIPHDERRLRLRRLDDILEALEQLNLHDQTELPDVLAERLQELQVEEPRKKTVTELIERVWAVQQPYLITVKVERRRRRRRQLDLGVRTLGQ